ncbi:MAG: hypothetical protein J5870_06640, partial [Clostridia bacterium]|nr:hypothetical protein [Clostridia bacterium]
MHHKHRKTTVKALSAFLALVFALLCAPCLTAFALEGNNNPEAADITGTDTGNAGETAASASNVTLPKEINVTCKSKSVNVGKTVKMTASEKGVVWD